MKTLSLLVLCVVAMITAPAAFGSLVAKWNFDNGTANDSVLAGGQQNGTLHGGVSIVNDNPPWGYGKAASFDGVIGSYIDCGVVLPKIDLATSACTVTAWVKTEPTPTDKWPNIVGSGWPFTNLMETPNGNVGIFFDINLQPNNVAAEIPVGEWFHLAGVYTGTKIQLYVNGRLAVSAATTGTMWGEGGAATRHFGIGGMFNQSGYQPGQEFKGMIDEVRWYNNALDLVGVRTVMYEPYEPESMTIALLGLGGLLLRHRIA